MTTTSHRDNEMTNFAQDVDTVIRTLRELCAHEGSGPVQEVLESAHAKIEQDGYDNWDGGTDIYGLYLDVPTNIFARHQSNLESIEDAIREKLQPIIRRYSQTWLGNIVISPRPAEPLPLPTHSYQIADHLLAETLEAQKHLMIAVSTGGPLIKTVNIEYIDRHNLINAGLLERGIDNPVPYSDLWEWYGKWSSGDLPTYQARREYINGLLNPVIKRIKCGTTTHTQIIFTRATGWARVDRSIGEMRSRLGQARDEEQFQAIGLLCRETLISLAQMVYNAKAHPSQDGVAPSKTDAKRMLDAYLASQLSGASNKTAQGHAKISLRFANELVHERTATFRQAAMCAEATTSVVNLIAIISGQRDPPP